MTEGVGVLVTGNPSGKEAMGHGDLPEMDLLERFRESMLDGTKLAASRPEPLGGVGTHFVAFGREFVLTDVRKLALGLAAAYLFRSEGFESKEDFIASWCEQYPAVGYRPDQSVYVHLFVKVGTHLH